MYQLNKNVSFFQKQFIAFAIWDEECERERFSELLYKEYKDVKIFSIESILTPWEHVIHNG